MLTAAIPDNGLAVRRTITTAELFVFNWQFCPDLLELLGPAS